MLLYHSGGITVPVPVYTSTLYSIRICISSINSIQNLLQTIAAARRLASAASNMPPVEPERIAAVVANWLRMRTIEGAAAEADSGAAEQLVERCLARVSDTEYRVALARRLEAHKIIVDVCLLLASWIILVLIQTV